MLLKIIKKRIHLHIGGPTPFKSVLFNSQLYRYHMINRYVRCPLREGLECNAPLIDLVTLECWN